MSTSELDKYKVDHLFLLVGENPLPNYVAARLLLNQGGTLYLVHTTHTEKPAKRLQTILKNELISLKEAQLVSLNEYESDAFQIRKAISSRLNINNGKIGLNYTGGTKAMAVHAYRTVFSKQHPDTVFSYLDPRKLEMCIDREDGDRIRIKVKPEVLQVKLAKLFQIHGLELKVDPTQEVQLADLAVALVEVFKEEDKAKQWFDWYYGIFREEARKKKKNGDWGDWKSQTALLELAIPLEKLPQEILTAFCHENFVISDNKLSLKEVHNKNTFTKLEHFCDWLDGLWLEHHALEQVKNISAQCSMGDYGMNFEVPLVGTENGFQFDLAFTRGYQLFAISVSTTSKRNLCKVKLFEAYLRARQMGGDEARVALICCTNEPDTLKAEMALLGDKKIAVFGRDDLMDLASRIAEWIQQNDKDASAK